MATKKLETIYDQLLALSKTSAVTDAQFDDFASLFTPDCSVNLRSMREKSTLGHKPLIDDLKAYLSVWSLVKRNVLYQASITSGQQTIIFAQMENDLRIVGQDLPSFPETVVAKFTSDGLCQEFRVYCCRSPQVGIIQAQTGKGPYSKTEMDTFKVGVGI